MMSDERASVEASASQPPTSGSSSLSTRVCERCNKSKRKCDKALPQCGRCVRLQSTCNYDYFVKSSHSSPNSDNYSASAKASPPELPSVKADDDSQARAILRTFNANWLQSLIQYFSTVHSWFSIIRPDTFKVLIEGHSDSEDRTWINSLGSEEYALLIICIHLVTDTTTLGKSEEDLFGPIYRGAKRAFASLTCLSTPTVELMQCGALLSLFEFGNGRATFAYRTLGETVTMAHVASLQKCKYYPQRATLLPAEEESTSLWWGMFILDQYIHMDSAARDLPLLLDKPNDNDLLPTYSVLWDGSRYLPFNKMLPVSVDVSEHLGTFQRSAQAANLLHAAHLWNSALRSATKLPSVAEFAHIDRNIRSALDAMLSQCDGWEVFCDGFAMLMSSFFILYRPYLHYSRANPQDPLGSPTDDDMTQSFAAARFAVRFIHDLAINFNNHLDKHQEWLANLAPPATISCFLAADHIALFDNVHEDSKNGFLEIQKSLETFSKRWRIGENMLLAMKRLEYMPK